MGANSFSTFFQSRTLGGSDWMGDRHYGLYFGVDCMACLPGLGWVSGNRIDLILSTNSSGHLSSFVGSAGDSLRARVQRLNLFLERSNLRIF